MKYFIKEVQEDQGVYHTAGVKARDDIDDIVKSMGLKEIMISVPTKKNENLLQKFIDHIRVRNVWKKSLADLKENDVILIQFPPVNHSIFLASIIKKIRCRGISIEFFIHDLESFRFVKRKDISLKTRVRLKIEEKNVLEQGDKIIASNTKMIEKLKKIGYDKNYLVSLEIFDYLIPNYEERSKKIENRTQKDGPIIIAGALRRHKAQYAYNLPRNMEFNLYGVGYDGEEKSGIHYFGSFPPDDLPFKISGSFGLVWDGESCDTCSGVYGDYLKINSPHKTSLYLASGFPVIIWSQAALAEFIDKNKCGITVDSLQEIDSKISKLSNEQYNELVTNAQYIGTKLREGYFTKKVI